MSWMKNLSSEQIQQGFQKPLTPAQKLQAAQLGIDPEMLERQYKMMQENPEMCKMAHEQMKSMSDDDLNNMARARGAQGFPPPSSSQQPDLPPLTITGKGRRAEELKNMGNTHFKKGQYAEASLKYEDALRQLNDEVPNIQLYSGTMEEKEALWKLWDACRLNLAACRMKRGDPGGAEAQCDVVLQRGDAVTSDSKKKAYYRRARARFEGLKFPTALSDVDEAVKLDPSDSAVHNLRKLIASTHEMQQKWERDGPSSFTPRELKAALQGRGDTATSKEELVDLARHLSPAAAAYAITSAAEGSDTATSSASPVSPTPPAAAPSSSPTPPAQTVPSGPGGMPDMENMSPEQFRSMIKQQRDMLEKNPSLVSSMASVNPQMKGMTAEALIKHYDWLLSMSPENLQMVMRMTPKAQRAANAFKAINDKTKGLFGVVVAILLLALLWYIGSALYGWIAGFVSSSSSSAPLSAEPPIPDATSDEVGEDDEWL